MLAIGCHLSSSKGFLAMGKNTIQIGGNTFQFFTRNPRGSIARSWDPQDAAALRLLAKEQNFAVLLAHAPYTLNACSSNGRTRAFAEETMADDLLRMELLPNNLYNFHPGSHVGQGAEIGIELIADILNKVLRPEQTTTVLLETMSGKGSEVGRSFAELRAILDHVALSQKMGVCLDTCHVHDAGYDLVNDLDGVLREFDQAIGLDRLRAIHLNDSMNPRGSCKDRHANIGQGFIGLESFTKIINHPLLRGLPFYLETPNELPAHAEEIALLKSLFHESSSETA